jgi:hypothetical protein
LRNYKNYSGSKRTVAQRGRDSRGDKQTEIEIEREDSRERQTGNDRGERGMDKWRIYKGGDTDQQTVVFIKCEKPVPGRI